jgi:hypothetical protein
MDEKPARSFSCFLQLFLFIFLVLNNYVFPSSFCFEQLRYVSLFLTVSFLSGFEHLFLSRSCFKQLCFFFFVFHLYFFFCVPKYGHIFVSFSFQIITKKVLLQLFCETLHDIFRISYTMFYM